MGSGLSSGNPFTDLFSLGLIPGAASGTDFAFGGPTLVGERGPELVNLPRGAQVIPNSTLTAKRTQRAINIVQHISVMPGASTASARQVANQLRDATSAAIRGR